MQNQPAKVQTVEGFKSVSFDFTYIYGLEVTQPHVWAAGSFSCYLSSAKPPMLGRVVQIIRSGTYKCSN